MSQRHISSCVLIIFLLMQHEVWSSFVPTTCSTEFARYSSLLHVQWYEQHMILLLLHVSAITPHACGDIKWHIRQTGSPTWHDVIGYLLYISNQLISCLEITVLFYQERLTHEYALHFSHVLLKSPVFLTGITPECGRARSFIPYCKHRQHWMFFKSILLTLTLMLTFSSYLKVDFVYLYTNSSQVRKPKFSYHALLRR